MPTYEYRCTACGHEFERFHKMSDPPIRTCPVCGKRKAERRISSGGGVVFKGPGFYATDYRKGGPPATREGGESNDGGESKEGEKKGGQHKKDAGSGTGSGSSDAGAGES